MGETQIGGNSDNQHISGGSERFWERLNQGRMAPQPILTRYQWKCWGKCFLVGCRSIARGGDTAWPVCSLKSKPRVIFVSWDQRWTSPWSKHYARKSSAPLWLCFLHFDRQSRSPLLVRHQYWNQVQKLPVSWSKLLKINLLKIFLIYHIFHVNPWVPRVDLIVPKIFCINKGVCTGQQVVVGA